MILRILTAPSILGLKPNGVARLPESLIEAGLGKLAQGPADIIHVPTLNHLYNPVRDAETQCLNPQAIKNFSEVLTRHVSKQVDDKVFPLVLGETAAFFWVYFPL